MQFILTGVLLFFAVQTSVAQQLDTTAHAMPRQEYQYYITKRNHNNTAAWICLGGGAALEGVTFLGVAAKSVHDNPEAKCNTGGPAVALAISGDVAMLSSIPLFIVAHHNKKEAQFALQKESITINIQPTIRWNYTGLGLRIPL